MNKHYYLIESLTDKEFKPYFADKNNQHFKNQIIRLPLRRFYRESKTWVCMGFISGSLAA